MIDEKRIADFFAELVSIDSPSLEEREMADTLKIKFRRNRGYVYRRSYRSRPAQCGQSVRAHSRQPCRSPGSLCRHMDTVEPAKGKKPSFPRGWNRNERRHDSSGADDLAGVTVIYEAVRHLIETKHRTARSKF